MTGSSILPYRIQFLFSDPEDDLDPVEAASLRHILQSPPGSNLLPGEGGVVWRTPPSLDLEFGDGVSAVFKNLSLPTKQTQETPYKPNTTLSANSTPFVPSLPYSTPTIPIPIPNPMTYIPQQIGPPVRPGVGRPEQPMKDPRVASPHPTTGSHIVSQPAMGGPYGGPRQPMVGPHGASQQPMGSPHGGPQQPMGSPHGGPQHIHINNLTLNYNGIYNDQIPPQHQSSPYTVTRGSDGQLYYVPLASTWASAGPPQSGGITSAGPPQNGGITSAGPPQNGGITSAGPPQNGGITSAGPPQNGGITSAGPPQNGGITSAGPPQNAGITSAGPPQNAGITSAGPPQISGITSAGPPQSSGMTSAGPPKSSGITSAGPSQSSGITFGSTPVISVNTVGRIESTSEEDVVNGSINTVNPDKNNSDTSSNVPPPKLNNIPPKVKIAQETPKPSKDNVNQTKKSDKSNVPQSIPEVVKVKENDKTAEIKVAGIKKENVASQESAKKTPAQEKAQPTSSWASLFSTKADCSESDINSSNKPTARIPPFIVEVDAGKELVTQLKESSNSGEYELGLFLQDYQLKHLSIPLLPRGLINRSNWCFVNSILQALAACPPFYNLLKSLPLTPRMLPGKSKTPMLDSMVEFVSEFSPLEIQEGRNGGSNSGGKKDRARKNEDLVTGIGVEPSYVYQMLLNLEADTFKVVEGRQEDAEEFLTCLLNGLSDEILDLINLTKKDDVEENEEEEEGTEDTDDDWQEVGAKGRSCITRRVADNTSTKQTPIQSLALGVCRSCVKAEGGDISATLQPFYTLQLDIQDSEVFSVTDALIANFASEQLDGFICSKTKKEVDATRSLSLEELPPILILHLKRFVYDGSTGGVQKVLKKVTFDIDLEIPKSVLSTECRSRSPNSKQRQYKLFSVVYHNGREATKGHYVTDIYQSGYSTWLHCDDNSIQMTGEQSVVQPGPTSTPYLLFYRRADTLVGREGGK